MKYIWSTILITTIGLSVHAQTTNQETAQCSLKLAQAPAIRGLKLGMKMDEVLNIFPGSRENENVKFAISDNEFYPRFGVVDFFIAPAQFAGKERFAGISSLYFVFVEGRMVRYSVEYSRPPWPRTDDFVNKIAGAFQLPPASNWSTDQLGHKNMACDGFRVQITARDGRGSVMVTTGDDPSKIQRDRRAAIEEKQRQEFKP